MFFFSIDPEFQAREIQARFFDRKEKFLTIKLYRLVFYDPFIRWNLFN